MQKHDKRQFSVSDLCERNQGDVITLIHIHTDTLALHQAIHPSKAPLPSWLNRVTELDCQAASF